MSTFNKAKVDLYTLSPIHIGSGNELQANSEYLYSSKEGVIGVVDLEKVFDIIGEEYIAPWVAAIEKQQSLWTQLPVLQKKEISDIAQRIITVDEYVPDAVKNNIKEQLFLGKQQATIPGSSVKGSVRTAVLSKLVRTDASFLNKKEKLKNHKNTYSSQQVEAHFFGGRKKILSKGKDKKEYWYIDPNKSLFRFLRISDFYFDTKTSIYKNTIINQFRDNWREKRELGSYWECIPPGVKSTGSIQISTQELQLAQKHNLLDNKANTDWLDIKELFSMINEHTLYLLDREIGFWEDEENPIAIDDYMDYLLKIEEIAKETDDNSCVLRVGAGSGWEYMTGGWVSGLDDNGDDILDDDTWIDLKNKLRKKRYSENTIFPKTRKMIKGGQPFGFVKLVLK